MNDYQENSEEIVVPMSREQINQKVMMFSKQFDEKEESMPAEVLQEGEENGQEEEYSDNERSTRARPYSSKPAYQGQRAQMQAHLSNAAYQEQMIDPSLKGVENLITSMKNDH